MAQRARNIGLSDYPSDYFTESSAESDLVESEEEVGSVPCGRPSRSKVRAPPRYPRPHSHLLRRRDGGRGRGNKHARRWENSMFISSLHQLPEEELERSFSIVPDHFSPLTKLHVDEECMKAWTSFTACSEEEQTKILRSHTRDQRCTPKAQEGASMNLVEQGGGRGVEVGKKRTEKEFRKIDRHIQQMMRHNKHLPLGFLQELEEELREYFMVDRSTLVVALQPNTFYRLLLHGLCQYMGLESTTVHKDRVSMVVMECTSPQFNPPHISLATHLTH